MSLVTILPLPACAAEMRDKELYSTHFNERGLTMPELSGE